METELAAIVETVGKSRPIQFSLRKLLSWVTLAAVFFAAATGQFGEAIMVFTWLLLVPLAISVFSFIAALVMMVPLALVLFAIRAVTNWCFPAAAANHPANE